LKIIAPDFWFNTAAPPRLQCQYKDDNANEYIHYKCGETKFNAALSLNFNAARERCTCKLVMKAHTSKSFDKTG